MASTSSTYLRLLCRLRLTIRTYVDSWAAYSPVMDILVRKAVIHGIIAIAQHFIFDLTYDVNAEAEFNET